MKKTKATTSDPSGFAARPSKAVSTPSAAQLRRTAKRFEAIGDEAQAGQFREAADTAQKVKRPKRAPDRDT